MPRSLAAGGLANVSVTGGTSPSRSGGGAGTVTLPGLVVATQPSVVTQTVVLNTGAF